jgi:hypothetical protein
MKALWPWFQILCVQSLSTEIKLIVVPDTYFLQSYENWNKPMLDLMYTDFWNKGIALELGVLLVHIGQHILLDPQKI